MSEVAYGDPFFMSVTEGNLNGHMGTEDLGIIYPCGFERDLLASSKSEVQTYGGAQRIYVCIPIGRVWSDTPHSDNDDEQEVYEVKTEMAETLIERMAAAAVAMGVSDAKGARY